MSSGTPLTEVTKETFLKIYGEAPHIKTLMPELIRKVFEKTGVSPFNPDTIPPEMMAPSKETSLEGPLPLAPSTPVHIVAASLHNMLHPSSKPNQCLGASGPQACSDITDLINHTICQLEDPELGYLIHTSQINASALQPPITTTTISPIKACYVDLLLIDPETNQDKVLILALNHLAL